MYNRDLFLKSIFKGDTIFYETALPLKGEEISLLYPIKKIISVSDFSLEKVFVEGKDYFVKDGKLIIPLDSQIPVTEMDDYYLKEVASIPIIFDPTYSPYRFKEKRYLTFGEGSFMIDKQIAISYVHDGEWGLFEQKKQTDKVSRFLSKLKNKKETNLVFFGDSITVGCNASGTEYGGNKPPYTESWPVMVHKYLENKYQTKINYVNTSVGGTNSVWAEENYQERVNKYKPDLLVLAFGMNDGVMPKEEHIKHILEIINGVKRENPCVEIVLISTTVPNYESNWFIDGMHPTYIEEYLKLNLPYVAICDMTHMHLDLLKRKRFKDMTGNNINHPNDFLIRIYAQSLLTVLGEEL